MDRPAAGSTHWSQTLAALRKVRGSRAPLGRVQYTAAMKECELAHAWQQALLISPKEVDEVLAAVTLTTLVKGQLWSSAVNFLSTANAHSMQPNVVSYGASTFVKVFWHVF